jgi:anti-sigma B factor antagonist
MERDTRYHTRVKVLDVGGDLNAMDMVRIKNRMDRLMEQEQIYMVLDLRKAYHADLAGLGILIERVKEVRRLDGDLRLAGVRPQVERLFKQTGTHHFVQFYSGVRAAVRSFRAA